MGFGPLRVINDDRVAPGRGFPHARAPGHGDHLLRPRGRARAPGQHGHRLGDQAGRRPAHERRHRACAHSEFNASKTEPVHFLQIWILPERAGPPAGYEQKHFTDEEKRGRLRLVASPRRRRRLGPHPAGRAHVRGAARRRAARSSTRSRGRGAPGCTSRAAARVVNGQALGAGDGARHRGRAAPVDHLARRGRGAALRLRGLKPGRTAGPGSARSWHARARDRVCSTPLGLANNCACGRARDRSTSARVRALALAALLGPGDLAAARRPGAAAAADDAKADALAKLRAGSELLDRGDYEEALLRFQDAYARVPSPKILYNFGLAYAGLGAERRGPRGLRALPRRGQGRARRQARQCRAAPRRGAEPRGPARDSLCEVEGADIVIDGTSYGRTPQTGTIYLDSGPHLLSVRKGAAQQVQRISAERGQKLTVVVALASTPAASPGPPLPPRRSRRRWRWRRDRRRRLHVARRRQPSGWARALAGADRGLVHGGGRGVDGGGRRR